MTSDVSVCVCVWRGLGVPHFEVFAVDMNKGRVPVYWNKIMPPAFPRSCPSAALTAPFLEGSHPYRSRSHLHSDITLIDA